MEHMTSSHQAGRSSNANLGLNQMTSLGTPYNYPIWKVATNVSWTLFAYSICATTPVDV